MLKAATNGFGQQLTDVDEGGAPTDPDSRS